MAESRAWPLSAHPIVLLRLARRNLLLHKLRSTLSILGVVFGVAAVVAMSSVGEGARREAVRQVGALGIDSITVRNPPAGDEPGSGGLLLEDVASIAAVVPGVTTAAALRETTLKARLGDRERETPVIGTMPEYRLAAALRVETGRFLTAVDLADRKRVAVLGARLARRLFPLSEARGQLVRLGSDWYRVVGVLEGQVSPRGKDVGPIRSRDTNQAAFVPLPTVAPGPRRHRDAIDELVVRVGDGRQVTRAAEIVQDLLKRRHPGEAFTIVVPREILRQKARTQRIFNVVTGAIAGISLLVGGIGIMNIMLATVAERTREIGIRRAVGATRYDVAAQFLAEAAALTSVGGLIGAGLGIAGSIVIQLAAGWPTALSPPMLLAALVTATGVGLGFGLYPAWHAAQLTPMEALRTE